MSDAGAHEHSASAGRGLERGQRRRTGRRLPGRCRRMDAAAGRRVSTSAAAAVRQMAMAMSLSSSSLCVRQCRSATTSVVCALARHLAMPGPRPIRHAKVRRAKLRRLGGAASPCRGRAAARHHDRARASKVLRECRNFGKRCHHKLQVPDLRAVPRLRGSPSLASCLAK